MRAGLAAAVIDAVMAPRIPYPTVEAVVARYDDRFGAGGGVDALAASFQQLGAPGWRAAIGTGHRVAPRTDAPHKSEVVQGAATLLLERGVRTGPELLALARDETLRAAWCQLPGQSSGFTWRRLLAAAGCTDPLVCPLTRRFARRWIGARAAAVPAEHLLVAIDVAAAACGVSAFVAEHQMWRAALTPRPRRCRNDGEADADVSAGSRAARGASAPTASVRSPQSQREGTERRDDDEAEPGETGGGPVAPHPVGVDLGPDGGAR